MMQLRQELLWRPQQEGSRHCCCMRPELWAWFELHT